jgi:hypothetical protein
LRPADARASAYIIRTLHKDFDPVSGSSSALMQAALGSVDLPSGVSEALSSLEMLSNIDKNPVLPNGTVFQKTHLKHARTHQTGPLGSPSAITGQLRSTTAPGQSVRSPAAAAATMQVRPTMVAPRTRVSHVRLHVC